jgi:hypothetical protein
MSTSDAPPTEDFSRDLRLLAVKLRNDCRNIGLSGNCSRQGLLIPDSCLSCQAASCILILLQTVKAQMTQAAANYDLLALQLRWSQVTAR